MTVYRTFWAGFYETHESVESLQAWVARMVASYPDLKGQRLELFRGVRIDGCAYYVGAPYVIEVAQ